MYFSCFLCKVVHISWCPVTVEVPLNWCSDSYWCYVLPLLISWADAVTHTDAMFCHCWFLELMQTYLSVVLFAPHLASPPPLSYIHFLHSHGLWYTPRTLSSIPYLADLSHLCGFPFFGMWIVLILCFSRSLLILLLMVWQNSIMAVPVGFLLCNFSSRFCCRTHLISLWLYLFYLKTCLRYISI